MEEKRVVRRYYTPKEVAMHNYEEDCWISIFHKVYDVTSLLEENRGPLTQPIIQHAGQDISHWFDPISGDVKFHVDTERNIALPFLPHGRFVHVAPPEPVSNWCTDFAVPWWRDEVYIIGNLTKKTRTIEIVNVLTHQSQALQVCTEETIREIQERYMEHNSHATSYTWKYLQDDKFVPLAMSKTLAENGVPDESEKFERLGINEDDFKPIIHVYFNDDLTVK